MTHHDLDPYPFPKERMPLYINEPELIDPSIVIETKRKHCNFVEKESDNIRVYIPMDLNKEAIRRRLDWIIDRYRVADENNELEFSADVGKLIAKIEIYDQIWFVRHMPESGEHSNEATALVEAFIERLEQIPDGCAESFPFVMIEELKQEYLVDIP